jgi:hypothetical protein
MADDLKRGWGVSPYLWQAQAAVQHELLANVALNAGYYRTWQGNIYLTDNLVVTAADFTPYCITAPANLRLPGGAAGIRSVDFTTCRAQGSVRFRIW